MNGEDNRDTKGYLANQSSTCSNNQTVKEAQVIYDFSVDCSNSSQRTEYASTTHRSHEKSLVKEKWLEQNRSAINACNELVENHGLFSDSFRKF